MLPFLDASHSKLEKKFRSWLRTISFETGAKVLPIEEEAKEWIRRLGQGGFLAHTVPKSFGGVRKTVQARDLCTIREALAERSALADTMFAVQALGSQPIVLSGTRAQKERYLPALGRGHSIGAFALTEPEAGSDAAAIRTRAKKRGDDYCLNGVKSFVSNAGLADLYIVFASTAPRRKAEGISSFLVEANQTGVVLKERTDLLSPHPIGVLAFEGCMVPAAARLGREGEGYRIALRTLDLLRCTVGAAAVGMARRALAEAVRYSQKRRQFGRRLAAFQSTRFKLAEMATQLEASRLLVYRAAWSMDCGNDDGRQQSSMAKLFATEAAQWIVDQSLQIHGGLGVVEGHPLAKLYRDVRVLRIYEGTSEIQKLIIGRSLLEKKMETRKTHTSIF